MCPLLVCAGAHQQAALKSIIANLALTGEEELDPPQVSGVVWGMHAALAVCVMPCTLRACFPVEHASNINGHTTALNPFWPVTLEQITWAVHGTHANLACCPAHLRP